MPFKAAISVEALSKCYEIYDKPRDRLLQLLLGGRKKRYREFWALQKVSFTINRGETVGIIGRNGSGKSTLLQMICGTVSPTSGRVHTNGRVSAILELGAGFNPEFTGRENVILNAAILGFSKEAIESRMDNILEFSELGEFLDRPVKTYSSGMYARLAFATAIHVDPEILIVDEALSVGDARFVAKCMRRIQEIKEQGTSILFVSHDVGSIRTLCQRVIWLENGRMVEEGSVFPVTGRYMEYLLMDDQRQSYQSPREFDLANEAVEFDSENGSILLPVTGHTLEKTTVLASSASTHQIDNIKIDPRPVTHWGSRKGLIISASVRNTQGIRKDVHEWSDEIEVFIDLQVPSDIPRDELSVAFSIKDLSGADLIVSTSRDFTDKRLPESTRFSVSFSMQNCLVSGSYLLVAAVESRRHGDIHYYEYIEGAHYFASLADARLFGKFHPNIKQQIRLQE